MTLLACLTADLAWFYLGRRGGKRVLNFLCRLMVPGRSVEQLESTFTRHGLPLIASAKFFPGLSVVAPPLAGAFAVPLSRFLLFDLLGSTLYTGFISSWVSLSAIKSIKSWPCCTGLAWVRSFYSLL
jgi:membrane protein DedA with SNARE-associated domain